MPLIVTTFPAQDPVTPAGSPVTVAPVAPVVLYEIFVIAVPIHLVWLLVPGAEFSVMVLFGVTVIIPAEAIAPHPPVSVTV